MFPQLKAYLSEKNLCMEETITGDLDQLTKKSEQYFNVAITPTDKQVLVG